MKKSLRIQSTDSEIMNHIISIIKESKRVRENFKVKTLNPKFDEVKNIKKEKDKRVKYIKEKNKVYKGYSDNVIDIEVDILTSKIDKDKGRKMITKISDMMNEVSSDIIRLERELTIYENSTNWLDWLNQMYLEIDSVQSYDLDKKQKFLNDYINKIDVEYLPKVQSHKFDFEFKYPIVEDKLIKDGLDKSGKRKYQIDKGLNTSSLSLQIPNNHKSKLSGGEKDELNRVISKFRVEDSLSLNEISKRLNDKGYRTLTNRLWNKSTLSLYIKRMKVDVGK
ncbi:hypothetical protein N9544_07810 [Flavobacteriales bacterium]|nr:hypothetical protein [Flavobacteriales bacterium]